jgi:hypothetical protein
LQLTPQIAVIRFEHSMQVRANRSTRLIRKDDLDPIEEAKRAATNCKRRSTSGDRIKPRDKLVFKQQNVHKRCAVSLARASGKVALFGLCCNKLREKRAVKKREIPSQPSE